MAHAESHRDLVNGQNRRIAFSTLQRAEILLRQAGALGELFLGPAFVLAEASTIVADEFPHIHA